jgi:hypothetical protein
VAAYREGRRDALLNGYGLPGIGTFLLRTAAGDRPALCLEADVAHTTAPGAYRPVATSAASPRLDYLLWRHLGDGAGGSEVDPDTATALAALAWYETGAVRRGGGAVWADPARGFAPITPRTPTPWDALPRLTLAHPIGLRAGGRDLDGAERRVLQLHLDSIAHRGPWTLSAPRVAGDHLEVRLTGPGGPIPDRPVRLLATADDRTLLDQQGRTDATGTARISLTPDSLSGATSLAASTIGPGPRQDWDGAGAVQRMTVPTGVVLRTVTTLPAPPTTISTTTTLTPTTTVPTPTPTIAPPPVTAPAPPTTSATTSTTTTTTAVVDTTATTTVGPAATTTDPSTTIAPTITTVAAPATDPTTSLAPSTTVAPPSTSTTSTTTSTTAGAGAVVTPAATGPLPVATPGLPRTGNGMAGRVADAAAVLVTLGLLLLAAGTGAVARRPRARGGHRS